MTPREYGFGFDVRCTCPEDARGPWDCTGCAIHGAEADAECAAQQAAEIAAENAWLVHAERGYDDGFDEYERRMGVM